MIAEEFLDSPQYPLGQMPEDWEQLVIVLKEYAKHCCQLQRQICADNALSYLDHNDNPCVSKGSILNAPEPIM
jgi:hypothetical protein